MRGGIVFLIFFVLFSVASYVIPVPLFPGSVVMSWSYLPDMYAHSTNAVVNGLVYGCVIWLVFVLVIRNFDELKVSDARAE
jgi:hypothetical protein